MKFSIELCETDLRALVKQHIESKTGNEVDIKAIKIQVKSKQNYASEWEVAAFRATYESYK